MDLIEKITNDLKTGMSNKRWVHSVGVAKTVVHLAKCYNVDVSKAYIAGLLHDCMKESELSNMQQLFDEAGYQIDPWAYQSKAIMHGPAAAAYIRYHYGIEDLDVLNAIYYHTTGRAGMSPLEKVVFLADFIEPNRKFPGIDNIRRLSDSNLDLAVLAAMNHTIKYLLKKNEYIYIGTLIARNKLLEELKKGCYEKEKK